MAPQRQFRVSKPGSRINSRDETRERLNHAIQLYEQAEGSLSITQAAKLCAVSKATLYRRINGRRDQVSYGISQRKLTPEEEDSIKGWVLEIQSWGFPPRVAQLREMAEELLRAKGDYKELGKNWVSGFLGRHPTLQAKYSRTLDQDRFLAQNRDIIQDWFNLYRSIKAEYGIIDEDTYNMDENGYMIGIAGSSKVVFSKYQKQAFINQAGNREWASLIEAIGTTGRRLPLFVILKGKKWKDDWFIPELESGDCISLSENGWTDNKLCMEWIQDCFEPATRSYLRGQYWLLIIDRHASHVSTEFIKVTQAHKIICLCLPPHSTHLLQPLDVSVFGPLKQNYKKLLAEKTRFSTYNIDKADFISLI